MILKPGDIVCVTDLSPEGFMDKMLGKLIVSVTKSRSADRESEFRHALMIINSEGDTFEALSTFKNLNMHKDYKDHKIIVGRHRDMTLTGFNYAYNIVNKKYHGKRYPWYRLLAHGSSALSGWTPMIKPVCSELTRMFTLLANCRDYEDQKFGEWDNPDIHFNWAHEKSKGYTPDNQADMIRGADLWDVIFYGDFN